jgi:hypothetical protein
VAAFGEEFAKVGGGVRDSVGGGDTYDIEAFAFAVGDEGGLDFGRGALAFRRVFDPAQKSRSA